MPSLRCLPAPARLPISGSDVNKRTSRVDSARLLICGRWYRKHLFQIILQYSTALSSDLCCDQKNLKLSLKIENYKIRREKMWTLSNWYLLYTLNQLHFFLQWNFSALMTCYLRQNVINEALDGGQLWLWCYIG